MAINLPVLLLPGMMADARVFLPQVVDLSRECAVQVAPTTKGDTIEEIARNVLALAPKRFALAGHAMGGVVAMEMLRLAPDQIETLMLLDTNCQPELPNVAAARDPQIARVRAGRLLEVMHEEVSPNALAPATPREEFLQLITEMAADIGPDTFVRQARAMQRRADQQATLRRARVPATIVCGEYDAICPVRRHEFMAHLMPNATLEVVEGAGHFPMLEKPYAVTEIMRRWLSSGPLQLV